MTVRAVLFNIYGTIIDIETGEKDWYTYLALAKFFGYKGINLSTDEVRWFYFEKIRQMLDGSQEKYHEIDIKRIWYNILSEHENPRIYRLNFHGTFIQDVVFLQRALTRRRLRLYDSARDVL